MINSEDYQKALALLRETVTLLGIDKPCNEVNENINDITQQVCVAEVRLRAYVDEVTPQKYKIPMDLIFEEGCIYKIIYDIKGHKRNYIIARVKSITNKLLNTYSYIDLYGHFDINAPIGASDIISYELLEYNNELKDIEVLHNGVVWDQSTLSFK